MIALVHLSFAAFMMANFMNKTFALSIGEKNARGRIRTCEGLSHKALNLVCLTASVLVPKNRYCLSTLFGVDYLNVAMGPWGAFLFWVFGFAGLARLHDGDDFGMPFLEKILEVVAPDFVDELVHDDSSAVFHADIQGEVGERASRAIVDGKREQYADGMSGFEEFPERALEAFLLVPDDPRVPFPMPGCRDLPVLQSEEFLGRESNVFGALQSLQSRDLGGVGRNGYRTDD